MASDWSRDIEIGMPGHPDVVANRIAEDTVARLTKHYGIQSADIDVAIGYGIVYAAGNVKGDTDINRIDFDKLLRESALYVLDDAGYTPESLGFNPLDIEAYGTLNGTSHQIHAAQNNIPLLEVHRAAPDHAGGHQNDRKSVINKYGDTRIVKGYYNKSWDSGLPLSAILVGNIIYKLEDAFKKGEIGIAPDGKIDLTLDTEGNVAIITNAVQIN
ncbi:MAG: hypothetical protein U9Q92_00930, partial [archaeon]|nr:hypothetical protein [archaeon]